MKDTLYKFWVLKVRLREWGGTGEGEAGGLNNTIGFGRDRSFNTHCSRIGSQCRSNETHIYRNRGTYFHGNFLLRFTYPLDHRPTNLTCCTDKRYFW